MIAGMTQDFLLLMHGGHHADPTAWGPYFAKLREGGWFQGGSSIGGGACLSKSSAAPDITRHLAGYIKIRATDMAHATELVAGNPVYDAGGVVEIRELPKDG
jgi:hypothetical protein